MPIVRRYARLRSSQDARSGQRHSVKRFRRPAVEPAPTFTSRRECRYALEQGRRCLPSRCW
jgi:hypothetical protein